MKAVNLLPLEARSASGNVTLRGASPATLGLLGGLALAVVMALGYVALSNGISDRRAELATVNAQSAAAQQRVATLKPYGDLAALRSTTLDQVRTLAGGRYDWPAVLSRFARALPSDSTLTSFNGGAGAAATATGAPTGPTVTLAGCTASHSSVGTIMDRLRAVEAVRDVTLQSSTVQQSSATSSSGSSGSGSGACGRAETFALTVTLDAASGTTTAAAAVTPAPVTPAPATTSTTPAATSTTPAASSTTAAPVATPSTPATTTPTGTP